METSISTSTTSIRAHREETAPNREAIFLYGAMMGVYLTLVTSSDRRFEKLEGDQTRLKSEILEQIFTWSPAGDALTDNEKIVKRGRYLTTDDKSNASSAQWAIYVLDDAAVQFVDSLKTSHSLQHA